MDIDAIKTGWHERLQHEQATTQASGFENQMKKLNRTVNERTVYGSITFIISMLGLCALIWLVWVTQKSIMVSAGLMLWVVTLAIATLVIFWARKNYQPETASQSTKQLLQSQRLKLQTEAKLHQNIVWWILIPGGVGMAMIFSGTRADLLTLVIESGVFLVGCYSIWKYNSKYVDSEVKPLAEVVEQRLALYEEDSSV